MVKEVHVSFETNNILAVQKERKKQQREVSSDNADVIGIEGKERERNRRET